VNKSVPGSSFRSTAKEAVVQSSIYSFGVMAQKLIGFLMIPIYTRFLVPAQYGTVEIVVLTVDLVGSILTMGITGAILRFYFDGTGHDHIRRVLGSGYLLALGSSVVLFAVGLLAAPHLAALLLSGAQDAPYFRIVFGTVAVSNLVQAFLIRYRAEKHPLPFVVWSLAATAIGLTLNIYLIVFQFWGVYGVLYSGLWTQSAIGAGLLAVTLWRLRLRVSRSLLKAMFVYCYPLAFSGVALFALQYADRYILKLQVGLGAVGIYGLAYKFALGLSSFLTFPFMSYWGAKVLELHNDGAYDQIARFFTYFLSAWAACGMVLAMMAPDIIDVIAARTYSQAGGLLPWLVLGMFFVAVYSYVIQILGIEKRTGLIARDYVIAAAFNIGLNLLLVPRYEALGAAIATAASFILLSALIWFDAHRVRRVDYEWTRLAKLVIVSALLVWLGNAGLPALGWDAWWVRAVLLLLWAPLLFTLGFFRPAEIRLVRDQWARLRNR